ncbi:hypothetical protein SG34_007340 [Thalassomonas viridans]|uniref:RND efflux pump membrane fusion protein barrel-sandwich domain-containing protein n=1 Tax=Thalassomonas viridans TaxID=137584 RepID=A0AAE9Z608_9GAMM|nr:hypothetical protein [Thalassomonas viridans]WDE06709.1 hypothetical protein SG34_007340 [Thalassomonas viridans]
MKKGIALLLVPAVVAAALYYFNRDTNTTVSASATVTDKTVTMQSVENIAAKRTPLRQVMKSTAAEHKPVRNEPQINTANTDSADEADTGGSLFVESEKAKEFLQASGKLRENLQGEVYIEISSNDIKSLEIGDTFKLEIPALDMFYDIQVDQTRLDQFGNQTIEAFLPDQEGKYSSIITVSERSIYGNITTPHGIYAIEGNGQYAWIAETAGLLDGVIQDQIGGDAGTYGENHNHTPIDTGNGKRSSTH